MSSWPVWSIELSSIWCHSKSYKTLFRIIMIGILVDYTDLHLNWCYSIFTPTGSQHVTRLEGLLEEHQYKSSQNLHDNNVRTLSICEPLAVNLDKVILQIASWSHALLSWCTLLFLHFSLVYTDDYLDYVF